MTPSRLLTEATSVGVIFLVIFAIIHMIFMAAAPDLSMSHGGIFGAAFLSAFLGHLFFEATGLNAKFVNDRIAMR